MRGDADANNVADSAVWHRGFFRHLRRPGFSPTHSALDLAAIQRLDRFLAGVSALGRLARHRRLGDWYVDWRQPVLFRFGRSGHLICCAADVT
jgi:hypothetical protein